MNFSFADNGIYMRNFLCLQKTRRVAECVNFAFTYDDLFQQYGYITILNYETARNSSASVIYIAIAGMSESIFHTVKLVVHAFVTLEIAFK